MSSFCIPEVRKGLSQDLIVFRIIEFNGGTAPLTYHRFQTLVTNFGHPAPDEPAVTLKTLQGCYTPISDDHDDKYGVPTLEELGKVKMQ